MFACLLVCCCYLAVSMVTVDQYKVTVKIIVMDFSGGTEIYDKIRMELSGLEIGILINNVGVSYDHPDYFLNVPDDRLWQLINVNMASVVMVCVTLCSYRNLLCCYLPDDQNGFARYVGQVSCSMLE